MQQQEDCADYLVKKGMPFRDAYKITGTIVAYCIDNDITLETLPIEKYKEMSQLFDEDVYKAISLDTCVKGRKSFGGPSPDAVKIQLDIVKKQLGM